MPANGLPQPNPQFQSFITGMQKNRGLGFNYQSPSQSLGLGQRPTVGQSLITGLRNKALTAQQNYTQQGANSNASLASDILGKSGGTVQYDALGHPMNQTLTDYNSIYNKQLTDTTAIGDTALQTAQAKTAFQKAQAIQDANAAAGATTQIPAPAPVALPAGAAPTNKGAQAVTMAMQAYQAHTPYVWGGNSLKNGVDCSGLTQQIYAQLGIKIPRTTYEQAKSGHFVNRNQLLPGDLIFYNTGSRDPNGIGVNGHVAIYMGNGKIIEAANSRSGIIIAGIDSPGQYNTAVRPW